MQAPIFFLMKITHAPTPQPRRARPEGGGYEGCEGGGPGVVGQVMVTAGGLAGLHSAMLTDRKNPVGRVLTDTAGMVIDAGNKLYGVTQPSHSKPQKIQKK